MLNGISSSSSAADKIRWLQIHSQQINAQGKYYISRILVFNCDLVVGDSFMLTVQSPLRA